MRRIYNIKKTISMKQFIAEFDEQLSVNIKERLLELGQRCILTRKEDRCTLDIKHIEHIQYETAVTSDGSGAKGEKEYSYGQFLINDENIYFSDKCAETNFVMQAPVVERIYKGLSSEDMLLDENKTGKKIDDSNINFIIDSILEVCPPVSQAHMELVQGMIERSEK